MLSTLKYSHNKLRNQLSHIFSGSDLIDSFYSQDVEESAKGGVVTLLQDRPVISLSLPDDNGCSIPYWIDGEREPIRIPSSSPAKLPVTKLPVDNAKVQMGEKARAIADPSARAQAIARMTHILSKDRATTRTAPPRKAPAKAIA